MTKDDDNDDDENDDNDDDENDDNDDDDDDDDDDNYNVIIIRLPKTESGSHLQNFISYTGCVCGRWTLSVKNQTLPKIFTQACSNNKHDSMNSQRATSQYLLRSEFLHGCASRE